MCLYFRFLKLYNMKIEYKRCELKTRFFSGSNDEPRFSSVYRMTLLVLIHLVLMYHNLLPVEAGTLITNLLRIEKSGRDWRSW